MSDSDEIGTEAQPTSTSFGAIRALRTLFIGTALALPLLATAAGYLSYEASQNRAAAALSEAVAIGEENTAKILDTHVLVAERINDLLTGLSDADIQAQQEALHRRMAQQIAELPQVAAAWAIGADGRELVSAKVFPVDGTVDQSRREDFRALQQPGTQTFIQAVRARSLDDRSFHSFFTLCRRRDGPAGEFRGIVVVAVSSAYLASFYNSLLPATSQYTADVIREDGTVLASYPDAGGYASLPQQDALAIAIAQKTKAGTVTTGSALDGSGRLIAYARLADYPVYVAISRTRGSITGQWARSMLPYVGIGVPAGIAVIVLSLVALRRMRREHAALEQARDASARRAAAEARLNQAQKLEAVGLLTAGIVHDFNNLLTIVSTNIVLLEGRLGELDARPRKYLEAALTGCERAAELTRRLLAFARHEPITPHPVQVNEIVASVIDLPWRLDSQIQTEIRLSSELWMVVTDPDQLANALLNLALNARDAMPDGGRLTIETENYRHDPKVASKPPGLAPGNYVRVSVTDTGSGISDAIRDLIFDPFFTTKAPGQGTGLGLAQVRGFIARFSGACTLDSTPGSGTTIRLYLPCDPVVADEPEAAPRAIAWAAMASDDGRAAPTS
jgi:two-component system NtrC family sensor kinase